MFGRFQNLYKPLKRIDIDQNKSQIILKGTRVNLVLLRPYDLVQLGAIVGSGSEDILIWTGKSIGKNLSQALQESTKEKKREKLIQNVLDTLNSLGFGKFNLTYKEGVEVIFRVSNPLAATPGLKDKADNRVLCDIYNGIFIGILAGSGVDVEGGEEECVLDGKPNCVYKYKFEAA